MLTFQGTSPDRIVQFFSLELDLKEVTRQIDVDEIIHTAIQNHWGLRLIRQDPWECLVSFVLSAFNNIPRLTGMLDQLAVRFGEQVEAIGSGAGFSGPFAGPGEAGCTKPSALALSAQKKLPGGEPCPLGPPIAFEPHPRSVALPRFPLFHRFPRPEKLAKVSERVLRNCGLGFRAPYVKAAVRAVARGAVNLQQLRDLEDEALRRALLTLPGVGEKVVECVMLFAYERTAAFPVDVWIGRVMRRWYFRGRKITDRKIREFARQHFGPYCGWAQQVLYCAARKTKGVRPQRV